MRRRKGLLPIILGGGNLKKGIVVTHGKGMRGFDLCIVWLKREFRSGEKFEMDDVEGIEAVIHFCDRKTLEMTVGLLNRILWECGDADQD